MDRWLLTIRLSGTSLCENVVVDEHPVAWLVGERREGRAWVLLFALRIPDDLNLL